MSVALHISDPHFGTEQAPVMQALLQLAHTQTPDVLLLSGDITQRARTKQFQAAANFIAQLPAPARVIIPGNHDIPLFNLWARIVTPYGNFQRAFGSALETEFESPDFLVLAINSTRPTRHKNGEINSQQLQRVAERLRNATPQQLRIVMMHHPVCAIEESDLSNLVHGYDVAIQMWSAAGADLILGGHIHLPYVRALNTVKRKLPRSVWAVQAGTALSHRTRGKVPNSVNILRTQTIDNAPHTSIERWDFDAATTSFVLVESTSIKTDRAQQ
ncbi:MAG: repair exonuclease [Verrucomicrobiaceae bacterium]|nr:repair exonuclease [Verrucomicrobiaceae bacterium]